MKTKKGLLLIGVLVLAFGAFAGVAFVQSSEVVDKTADNARAVNADGSTCPGEKGAQAAGAPGSCAEVHAAALAAGKLSQDDYLKAEVQLASVASGKATLTPEECKELMAKAGYECNEKDLKACAEKIQSLGFCKDMTVEECATKLAEGACEPLTQTASATCNTKDMAACATTKAGGACCAAGKTVKSIGGVEVKTASVTETTGSTAQPKVCDLSKGTCGPDAKKSKDD